MRTVGESVTAAPAAAHSSFRERRIRIEAGVVAHQY